jgi:prepilin-type processing-associated H-X9-DG protein
MISLSSTHSGGANVALADGSGRFLSEMISGGDVNFWAWGNDFTRSMQSPYGVIGALGSVQGGESVSAP